MSILQVHDVEISTCTITHIVQWFAFDNLLMLLVELFSCVIELSSLELTKTLQAIASVVASIVKVDVSISTGAVDSVVRLLCGQGD